MAGAGKKDKTDPLRIAVPARLREYLVYLSRTTTLGASANDVALSVLTPELERMRATAQYRYVFPDEPAEAEGQPKITDK
jgi:hypothetical protein